jgi:hypothetical protein
MDAVTQEFLDGIIQLVSHAVKEAGGAVEGIEEHPPTDAV